MKASQPIRVNLWREEGAQDWSVEIISEQLQDPPLALIEEMVAEALFDAGAELDAE